MLHCLQSAAVLKMMLPKVGNCYLRICAIASCSALRSVSDNEVNQVRILQLIFFQCGF